MERNWFSSTKRKESIDYSDRNIQLAYIRERLPRTVKLVRGIMRKSMESAILAMVDLRVNSYRILCLGTGAGSEILAAMKIFQSVNRRHGLSIQRVKFVGVDKWSWPMETFNTRFSAAQRLGSIGFERPDISQLDMEAITPGHRGTFHFIILSFADVKSKMEFVHTRLRKLLNPSTGGRIVVIDNNIGPVRQLKQHGFVQEGLIRGKTTCLVLTQSATAQASTADSNYDDS